MAGRILIALSSLQTRERAEESLRRDGHQVVVAVDDDAVWNALVEQRFDLVIADAPGPGLTLVGFLRRLEQAGQEAELLVLVPEGRPDLGWSALNEGAHGFLEHPLAAEPLRVFALRALEHSRLRRECAERLSLLRDRHSPAHWLDFASIARLRALIESRLLDSDPVLFYGERGTEAPELARLLHYWGLHPGGPYLTLPAALQSASSLEAALFGSARMARRAAPPEKHPGDAAGTHAAVPSGTRDGVDPGTHTHVVRGTTRRRPGWIEQAHGGTLFIEDLTRVPLQTQVRLARMSKDGQFLPPDAAGDEPVPAPIHIQVRLVFCTHQSPEVAVANGGLEPELYTLLRSRIVRIPPLRERSEDVPDLARALLDEWGAESVTIDAEANDWLRSSPWPGNRLELEATLLRAFLARRHDEELTVDDLRRSSIVNSKPATGQRQRPLAESHEKPWRRAFDAETNDIAARSTATNDTEASVIATRDSDASATEARNITTSNIATNVTEAIKIATSNAATNPTESSNVATSNGGSSAPGSNVTAAVPDLEHSSTVSASTSTHSTTPANEKSRLAPTHRDDDLHLPVRGVDLVRLERRLIQEALARTQGNQTHAARLLGLTRQTLIYRMQKHGIR